jgi:hypothetical protein
LQQQRREPHQAGHQQHHEDEGDNRSFYGSDSQVGGRDLAGRRNKRCRRGTVM